MRLLQKDALRLPDRPSHAQRNFLYKSKRGLPLLQKDALRLCLQERGLWGESLLSTPYRENSTGTLLGYSAYISGFCA